MADGQPGITSFPLVYVLRHMRPGRKQATTTSVVEEQVVRLPGWSAEQAPLVGTVEDQNGVSTDYRAIRGADGVVRLGAGISSAAMGRFGALRNQIVMEHTDIRVLRYDRIAHRYERPVASNSPELGVHLSSNRTRAHEASTRLREQMALVDGVLYLPCFEPGWNIDVGYAGRQPFARELHATTAAGAGIFVPFCRDPAAMLPSVHLTGEWPGQSRGRIVEHVRAGFGGDAQWYAICDLAQQAYVSALKSMPGLLEDEYLAIKRFRFARDHWPNVRDMDLVRQTEAMIRVLHSINTANNVGLLEAVTQARAMIDANPAPMPLELRLELAGITIPQLPVNPLVEPGGAPGLQL